MDSSPMHASRGGRWLAAGVVVVFFLVLGALPFLSDRRDTLPRLLYWAVDGPLVVLALSFHYEWAERRGTETTRTLMTSVSIAMAISVACAAGTLLAARGLRMEVPAHVGVVTLVVFGAASGLMQCGVWALAFVWPTAVETARTKALETEKLKLEAEQLRSAAELARLRSQLEPHFLMNTLNAIAALVTQRPRDARHLLGALGDLLRDSLRDPDDMQSIADELAWLRRYAEILEARHAGALVFRWEPIDAEARAVRIPRLLLQPLVENAIVHGALRRNDGGGEVTVRVVLDRDDGGARILSCAIEDNGPGLDGAAPRDGAIGLRSVRRRLALAHPGASLDLTSSSRGTRAEVRVPFEVTR